MASEGDKRVLDIKTGHAPESTSRPIIVSNRSMVKDPTVKDEDKDKASKKDEEKIVKSEAKPLKPLSKDLAEKHEEHEESEQSSEATSSITDEAKDDDTSDEAKEIQLSAEEKSRQEETAKLVASGKYIVPIGHIERNQRLRKILSIIILVLLLGIAAGWLLMRNRLIKL